MQNSKKNYGKSLVVTSENVMEAFALPAVEKRRAVGIMLDTSSLKVREELPSISTKKMFGVNVINAILTSGGIVTSTVKNSARRSVKNSTTSKVKSQKTSPTKNVSNITKKKLKN